MPFQAMRFRSAGAAATDPYFANVSSLLHMDGANGSTTFTDQKGKTWTAGGTADISTSFSVFGGASGDFPGQYISTPNHADFDFGSGDFTVEGWVRITTIGSNFNGIICHDNISVTRGWLLYKNSTAGGGLSFAAYVGGTGYTVTDPSAPAAATWIYVAAVRDGGTLRLYKNGVQVASTAITGTVNNPTIPTYMGSLVVSGSPTGGDRLNGYLDEWRVTKGVCRYPSGTTYTVPTSAFPNS